MRATQYLHSLSNDDGPYSHLDLEIDYSERGRRKLQARKDKINARLEAVRAYREKNPTFI